MNVPLEILQRYAAGEREIRVSPRVYAEYCDTLTVMYRRCPNEERTRDETWVAFKAGRVIAEPHPEEEGQ